MARRTPARLLIEAAVVLAALLLFVLLVWTLLSHWQPDEKDFPIQGVDVSARNGAVDWPMVHARGADFAYAVATEGADTRDARFEENWQAIPRAAMRRGAIHRYSLCAKPEPQAANFVRTVPREADALPSAVELDFEAGCDARPTQEALIADLSTFLTLAEHHMGKPMLLIVSDDFDDEYHVSGKLPRPVWATRFFFEPDYPEKPWRMWRASTIRRIDGAAGAVNWDVVVP